MSVILVTIIQHSERQHNFKCIFNVIAISWMDWIWHSYFSSCFKYNQTDVFISIIPNQLYSKQCIEWIRYDVGKYSFNKEFFVEKWLNSFDQMWLPHRIRFTHIWMLISFYKIIIFNDLCWSRSTLIWATT